MKTLRTVTDVRDYMRTLPPGGFTALVPTMGALHAGHTALFAAARIECRHVIGTIFVNPGQFNDAADFAAYPRDQARDLEIAAAAAVDAMFIPAVEDIYPPGDATTIRVQGAAVGFEGSFRPGHFDSVATVCLKLFNIIAADVAYFGQKDAQQVAVIRQLIRDLHLALQLQVVATVRDSDGLALSSRNARLSPEERGRARSIPRALSSGLAAYAEGADPVTAARGLLTDVDVDYVDVARFDEQPTLVIAARVGNTRLIDNAPLDRPALAGFAGYGRSDVLGTATL
jgi:pantoate--beta-alanine ligase